MHFYPLISVEADSPDDAVGTAESALDQYQKCVWDWLRPDETHFDGVSAICFTDDPERFAAELDRCLLAEREELERAIKEMQAQAEALELLLKGKLDDRDARYHVGYSLYQLGELLTSSSDFTFRTSYYDGVEEQAADYDAVRERCESDPESQWLVAMDIHF